MNFRKIYLFLLLASLISLSCGKEPVFTEMSTNRLRIIIKGTFETEEPSNFISMNTQALNTAPFQDDSVDEVEDGSNDAFPDKLMIDIAEIRLDDQKISNYRQVFTIPLDDSHPFFNGEGIELKTDDPGKGNYSRIKFYIRKMAFNNAMIYKAKGPGFDFDDEAEFVFHEKDTKGFDFNQLMVNSYWDGLREEANDLLRVFPMKVPIIGGLKYDRKNDETVIEVRFVIKNFIKKYEYDYYDDGDYKLCHYYAPSDWLRDVKAGETDIGRNLHAVARAYIPGETASVTVNSATGYVVAIPSTETISRYYLTDSGINIRAAVGKADLPMPPSYPGNYIVPVLDYYLNYEKYKSEWNTQVTGLTLDEYEAAWDEYEIAVKGDPEGDYNYGLKIPPYVAYCTGTSVLFSNMAPGEYNFYNIGSRPSYGELFLESSFVSPVTAVIKTGNNTVIIP